MKDLLIQRTRSMSVKQRQKNHSGLKLSKKSRKLKKKFNSLSKD